MFFLLGVNPPESLNYSKLVSSFLLVTEDHLLHENIEVLCAKPTQKIFLTSVGYIDYIYINLGQ